MTTSGTTTAAAAATATTSGISQPHQHPHPLSPGGRGASSMPREQLKSMAAEMNTILTKLMGAMNVGAEERHRLRQELAEAQERLSALKELQRQMTEAGVVPPDRIPLEQVDDADIPVTGPAVKTAEPQSSEGAAVTAERGTSQTSTVSSSLQSPEDAVAKLSCSSSPPASPQPASLEASIEPDTVAKTAAAPTPTPDSQPDEEQSQQQQQDVEGSEGALVHHGIQETTQLEESVEALTLTSTATEFVAMKEADEEDDEDDDDNNEVSVKDLPLPDINLPVEEEEQGGVATSQPASSLLDAVDLDDSDSDTEGGPSRLGAGSQLATTLEDQAGEEREEEEDEEEEGDGVDQLGVGEEEDALLRKISASSLLSSSLLSAALASPSSVDTEIITVSGEEGNNNKDSSSSNVDNQYDADGTGHGSSSVDGDTTSPIEI
ncbi:hypothetical protein ElyMa_002385000 [Elysia marginata]|uniref:Uncharacterized protein n=1 Tax=Elysia marginata TaxID=1093978 RepID=A0AAV4GBW9_9GAST|nr:hypothetical protein ElyMa_002385000 [Elysia marginata]